MSEVAKKVAAEAAVNELVKDGQCIGIGSGSTIVFAVDRLAERVQKEKLHVVCVPTSFQATELILSHQLPLGSLDQHPVLDLAIDGADEIDANLNLIKGGGGCHTQEKLVAANAHRVCIVADDSKLSECLEQRWLKGVPVEVLPMARTVVSRRLKLVCGAQSVQLRMATSGKAGPVVTDQGNFILDCKFGPHTGGTKDLLHLDSVMHQIPGVLETGFFIEMATDVFVGRADGSVKKIKASNLRE